MRFFSRMACGSGKGLQLVNILRDLPRDLRQGRCYIPRAPLPSEICRRNRCSIPLHGPLPSLYDRYLRQAEEHLAAGQGLRSTRSRAASFGFGWPALCRCCIGTETLARLRTGNVLDDRHTIKVSRSGVRRLILVSLLHCLRSGVESRERTASVLAERFRGPGLSRPSALNDISRA